MSVELWNNVVKAAGGVPDPENTLETTLMRNVINACGGNCDNLPDNLKSTLLVAMADAVASSAVEEETKTISPDFSGGDVVVTPTEGKLLSEVTVQKPETLVPENIAKDVDIAGVVGTLETGGGGGNWPLICATTAYHVRRGYISTSSNGNTQFTPAVTLPKGSIVLGFGTSYSLNNNEYTASSISESNGIVDKHTKQYCTVKEVTNGVKVSVSQNVSVSKLGYWSGAGALTVTFIVPGFSISSYTDPNPNIYADSTVTSMPECVFPGNLSLGIIDLSQSQITTMPIRYMAYYSTIQKIVFPATITTLEAVCCYSPTIEVVDFSRCTSVPTGANNIFNPTTPPQILVPAALYDSWITASYWSTYADYIVAV